MDQTTLKENKIKNTASGEERESDLHIEYTTLNLGPTHPATHGIFQNILTMDGEIVIDSEPVSYTHLTLPTSDLV